MLLIVLLLLLLLLLVMIQSVLLLLLRRCQVVFGNDVNSRLDGETQLQSGNLVDIRTERVLIIGAHVGIVGQLKQIRLSSSARTRSATGIGRVGGSDGSTMSGIGEIVSILRVVSVQVEIAIERVQIS